MGYLNFILAFSFVFLVIVPTIGFYCDLCFQKKIHFVNFGGFFVFFKFKCLQFSSCHFGGPHFLFFV